MLIQAIGTARRRCNALAAMLALSIVGGCAPGTDIDSVRERRARSLEQAQLSSLAHDYLFKQVGEPEAAAILARVRALSPSQAERFHALLLEMNGYDANERWISTALFQHALARGVSFLDLTSRATREVMERLVREEADL